MLRYELILALKIIDKKWQCFLIKDIYRKRKSVA